MTEISAEQKEQILSMICIPGLDLRDIAEKLNIDQEKIRKFLEEEYNKHNLQFGRRLCCRC
jgi:transposase-like protein